jgi:hypothetical protein
MPNARNGNANAAGSLFDLANCQGRDYRPPEMMNGLMITLRDKDLQLWRRGLTVPRRPRLLEP